MAKKKRLLDDGDSDSPVSSDADFDDPDMREEREMDPYRKRRRTNWTKAPAFVSSDKPVTLDEPMQVDSGSASEASEGEDEEDGIGVGQGENEGPPIPAFAGASRGGISGSKTLGADPIVLPTSEMAHFQKLQGTFGAKMLAKMGWKAGTGLGVDGEGIVIPIDRKVRPQKMGIAFKGFQEKTEQSKMEARRRGEIVSDDEDEATKRMKKKVKETEQKRSATWRRPKKVKTIIEHKTYDEILAEAGEATVSGNGQIIDYSWTPTGDLTRIPEMRHNIRLISDACRSDLDGLAREARALNERKRFVTIEDARLRKRIHSEAELISRLQQIHVIVTNIDATAKELSSLYEISLEPFEPHFQKLLNEYAFEFEKYNLDEIVVGSIAPLVKRMAMAWNPLEDPTFLLPTFRSWRNALKVSHSNSEVEMQIDRFGSANAATKLVDPEKPMTPFESLLWNVWLPKVRAALNNDWSPTLPKPAVKLYESWSSFVPTFIRDNILDQLILPKIQKAIADWSVKKSKVSLQAIVFPWLPHVGLRLEDVVGDARRKIKSLLRAWVADEDIPNDLLSWREVFDAHDWDAMLLKYIVPKLGAALRSDFRINPRDQKMDVLQRVLVWSPLMKPSMFCQILETEFFPKWLDVLHIWLVQPRVSFDEVAQWYSFWKETFPEEVRTIAGIDRGFTRGLQLMNLAVELGPEAQTRLAKPDFLAEIATASSSRVSSAKPIRPSPRSLEITFRSIVEEYAASHNLLFIPAGKAHELSRMPLYRVSRRVDGKKGLLVYILDDAVWAPKGDVTNAEAEEFRAISLEDMVVRAS